MSRQFVTRTKLAALAPTGVAVAFLTAFLSYAPPSGAQIYIDGGSLGRPSAAIADPPAPSAMAADPIVAMTLENPTGPESKSYLDLDSGKVFPYGESKPQSFLESRRWVADSGADLMCETRPPAEGLVAYNMVLIPTAAGIDQPRVYADLKKQLDEVQSDSFQMMSAGTAGPKTYLFRTHEGALGVLEISTTTENPAAMRLRYKIVHAPPLPILARRSVIRINGGAFVRNDFAQLQRTLGLIAQPSIEGGLTLARPGMTTTVPPVPPLDVVAQLKLPQPPPDLSFSLTPRPKIPAAQATQSQQQVKLIDVTAASQGSLTLGAPGVTAPATRPSSK